MNREKKQLFPDSLGIAHHGIIVQFEPDAVVISVLP